MFLQKMHLHTPPISRALTHPNPSVLTLSDIVHVLMTLKATLKVTQTDDHSYAVCPHTSRYELQGQWWPEERAGRLAGRRMGHMTQEHVPRIVARSRTIGAIKRPASLLAAS